MKDLFVPLCGLRGEEVLVDSAIAFAHAYRTRLSLWMPPPALGIAPLCGSASREVLAGLIQRADLLAAERASALRERLRAAGMEGEVRVESVELLHPAAAMALRARCADLAVVARASMPDDAVAAHDTFCTLLSTAGRPVLVMPPGVAMPARRFGKVLLAWKPTRESARACFDALTLLQPGAVDVVVVAPSPDDADSAATIATRRSRRSSKARG